LVNSFKRTKFIVIIAKTFQFLDGAIKSRLISYKFKRFYWLYSALFRSFCCRCRILLFGLCFDNLCILLVISTSKNNVHVFVF